MRTSKILRDLLEKNPDKSFTVQKIVDSIGGSSSFGTSLLVSSIPEVLPIPIPGIFAIVVIPTGIISAQMIAGNKQLKLPKFILKRTIHRKALATAIHAILPFLEKTEKYVKPRWQWAVHPASRRFIGAFILLLAAAMALPVPWTNMPLAISIFIIALGLIEKDGMMITLGILIGLASLAFLGGIIWGALSLFSML
ncbi:MAG: exopolysaccharide biosynthesis protein [Methylacidiphilales bacterium]|nr:exopolysaccharide biosynthesis protein [Candidatus Methylacidiphilales bacterium]